MHSYTTHTASRHVFVDAPFACSACGFRAECRAYARGRGHARSSGWGPNPGAARDAEAGALRSAYASARQMLELAPCPRCGKRNAAAVSRFRTRLAVTLASGCAITLGAAAGAIVAFGAHRGMMGVLAAGLSGFVALVVAAAAASAIGDWLGAAKNVEIAPLRPGQVHLQSAWPPAA